MQEQTNPVTQERYEKNVAFWETAWSRVKKALTKIPDVLDYIPEIPKVFTEHDCKHILDIACGSGWLSFYLNTHGFKVTGVDISESGIRLANEMKEEVIQNPEQVLFEGEDESRRDMSQVEFAVADMFAMDYPEDSFDGILINAAFEHLDKDRGIQFIHEMKKFLKPNAIMFAVFDKVASGKRGEFELLEDGTHQYIDEYRDGMFLRNYSDDELAKILADAKFEVLSVKKNAMESRIVIAKNLK